MKTLTQRFLDIYSLLVQEKKVTGSKDFAEKIGISTSMMTEIVKGRSNVGATAIQNIVIFFPDISPQWLLTGDGEMLKTAEKSDVCEVSLSSECDNNKVLVEKVCDLSAANALLKKEIEALNREIGQLRGHLAKEKGKKNPVTDSQLPSVDSLPPLPVQQLTVSETITGTVPAH